MKILKIISILLISSFSLLSSSEFTYATYNCGALSFHYDYIRAVGMQKIMQERYSAEPEMMGLNERIQQVALKLLFAPESDEKQLAQLEWDSKGYQALLEKITAVPSKPDSMNTYWHEKVNAAFTPYNVRPINIYDPEILAMLNDHVHDLSLDDVRATMAKSIFNYHLKADIICLQEADYLNESLFPQNFEVRFKGGSGSRSGLAWNKDRFEILEAMLDIPKAVIAKLKDKETGKIIVAASGHLKGCNPFYVENNDSAVGDKELSVILKALEEIEGDIKLLGMDSNVTSLHPRLNLLKDAQFTIDYENFIEPTCANPYQVLNTRIDWIALKGNASIANVPVLSVGLNNLRTNMSDHKPVAAKIKY